MIRKHPQWKTAAVRIGLLLAGTLGASGHAQDTGPGREAPLRAALDEPGVRVPDAELPDAPSPQTAGQPVSAGVTGTVTDSSGAVVAGAVVTIVAEASGKQRMAATNAVGMFTISGLQAGTVRVTVAAKNFTAFVANNVSLSAGELDNLGVISLQVGSAATEVNVVYSQVQVAEEQLHAAEKQRVLGIIPNFDISYVWDAAPLTARQKFKLGLRSEVDPITFLGAAVGAGYEQAENDFDGYGQGAAGYFKRFGASYTDGFVGEMIGGAILPSLLRQDPRYFYKGIGTKTHRALYAVSTVVICKGDNGKWQPNYSNVIGSFAAGGISNLYYPASNRHGARLTVDNALLGFAAEAIGDLFQEFLIKKISTGVKKEPAQASSGNEAPGASDALH